MGAAGEVAEVAAVGVAAAASSVVTGLCPAALSQYRVDIHIH